MVDSFILGLTEVKTQERGGVNITSCSKIQVSMTLWFGSVAVKVQIALVTDQAMSQACHIRDNP